jgi:hypothetical protein
VALKTQDASKNGDFIGGGGSGVRRREGAAKSQKSAKSITLAAFLQQLTDMSLV